MSAADGWDLTVPEDAADLAEEFRRHGVRPGQRLRIVSTLEAPSLDRSVPAANPDRFGDRRHFTVVRPAHTPSFILLPA